MFTPLTIADRHTLRLSATAESADTTINVNGGGRPVPPRPEFRLPQRHTDTVTRTTTSPRAPAGETVHTETKRQINWGGMIKGAAIIGAVILVGVVAASVAPPLLASIGLTGPTGLLTGLVQTVGPTFTAMGGYAMNGINFLDNFIFTTAGNIFSAIGGLFAGGSVAAAATAAPAATVAAVNTGTGALAAGAAIAISAPIAVKAIMSIPVNETVQVTHAHALAPVAGLDGTTTSNTVVHHGGSEQHASSSHHNVVNPYDMIDENMLSDQSSTSMKAAGKMAHHAHGAEQAASRDGNGEPPQRARSAMNTTARASQAWTERVATPREKPAVTPRNSQFSEQLNTDRAQLDAALAEGR